MEKNVYTPTIKSLTKNQELYLHETAHKNENPIKSSELLWKNKTYKLLMAITINFPKRKTNLILGRVLFAEKRANDLYFKGALSGLRQFLATGSSLKLTKNAICVT